MEIAIREANSLDLAALLPLYEDAGWRNYTSRPEMLEAACRASLLLLGAFADARLVGLIRVVGDGHSIVYIQDILVLKAYRRRGIGGALLQEALRRYARVYQTVLLTDDRPETVAFYRAAGFVAAKETGCLAFVKQSV